MDLFRLVLGAFVLAFLFSCSPTQKVSENTAAGKPSLYPDWFVSDARGIGMDSESIRGYGAAVAGDSSEAVSKAVREAQASLSTAISERLESVRLSAVDESGENSQLDSPGFILSLRQAESVLADRSEVTKTETRMVQSYNTFRGFAEVRISKSEVIDRLDELLRSEEAWRVFKETESFQEF